MSETPPIQYSGPSISPHVDWDVRRHLQLIYQKLGNHTQAFQLFSEQLAALQTESTTSQTPGVTGVLDGGTGTQSFPQNSLLVGNGVAPIMNVAPVQAGDILVDNGPNSPPSFQPPVGYQPLMDGYGNFVFAEYANGIIDIIVVAGYGL